MFLGCVLREPEDGGECIYNCAPNDGMFCRVEFEMLIPGPLGNLKGLCFKNKACFGTPKACTDCNLKCQDYVGCSPTPTSAPAPATALAFVPTTDSVPVLDKTPPRVLFPDRLPINDLSTGIPVDETHCVRRATNSINSACLVSNLIENNLYVHSYH